MKRTYFVCLFLCLTTTFLLSQSNRAPIVNETPMGAPSNSASHADPQAQARILDSYGKLPLSFEANHGQTDAQVKFLSRTSGYTLFLTGDEAVLVLNGKKADAKNGKVGVADLKFQFDVAAPKPAAVLRMKLRNANPAAKVIGMDELAGINNYFIGNNPAKWRRNVPTYAKVKYEGIYSGIDLVYYGNHRQLEYDFIVAPGANSHRIAFDVRGAKRILRDAHGDLVFKIGEDEILWHKPVVYQEKNGARQEIAAHYAVTNPNRVRVEVAKYDTSRPLYIDPLVYSTYLGGSGGDVGASIAVDSAGNAYVTGSTDSTDFPTINSEQPTYGGGFGDAFVTKINSSGSALVYSTYLGGSDADYGYGIAADGAGNAYVTGATGSTDFPVTPGAFQTSLGGQTDAFVTKINSSGSALVYSTYLGGSQSEGELGGTAIAIDSAGNAYVTGATGSTDFPVTPGAFQTIFGGGQTDAFVTKINSSGSGLVYSTYLGGSDVDYGNGIAADGAGNAYVTGTSASTDFPVTPGAFQTAHGSGTWDGFVTKLNPTGAALAYSTYFGGYNDFVARIAVDSAGDTYVTGTASSAFPTTLGAFQTTCCGAFLTKLTASGSSLAYSTYLGGSSGIDQGFGIAVDSAGDAYLTGTTYSTDFPTTPGAFQTTCHNRCGVKGQGDAFVTRFNAIGSALIYSTYLGGNRGLNWGYGVDVDSLGDAYVTGSTTSSNFPTKNPIQVIFAGGDDAFVTEIQMLAATTSTLSSSPNPSTHGQGVAFTSVVTSYLGAPPDGETVSFMKGKTALGTGTLNGGMATFTTSTLKVGTTTVKAVYGGDSTFAGSTSNTVKQVVKKAD